MTARRTILVPMLTMAAVSLLSVGLAVGLLYSAALESERSRLMATVERRARLLGNLAERDLAEHSAERLPVRDLDGTSLGRAIEAYRDLGGFGHTGEFALARREGNDIVFVLGPCEAEGEDCSVPLEETVAEPMRRALHGGSGTLVGSDYRGVSVLAAHAPIESIGWGAVVKTDLTEVRRPFITAAALTALAALLAIIISAYLFFRPTSALIKRLREDEAVIRTIVETAAEGIIIASAVEGRIESFNSAAERMFAYGRDEILGERLSRVIPDFNPTRSEVRGSPDAASTAATREATGRRKDGSTFPLELSKSAMSISGDTLLTVILRDITDRKAAERDLQNAHDELATMNQQIVEHHRQLVQSEKLSSIGLLAAGVAHEINNPLSGVKACVKALDENKVPPAQREKYFGTAREGLDRIQRIVRNLLNYAKERSLAPTAFDAAEVVSSSLALVAPASQKKRLAIENRIAPGHVIDADRAQITQALVNVILNAIHAAPEGSEVELSASAHNGHIGVRITDHGPGIPEENLSKVCDPFFTTKPVDQGTGLGLAVTDGIVRSHHGRLVIDSVDGSGTSVTMWLPAHENGFADEAGHTSH